MAYTTQYIGSRYVPLFAEPAEWNSARTYEPLTIVMHDGNSYTSRQYVPVGIDITNEKFWALTGNYNAQVEAYRQEVRNLLPYDDTPTDGSTKAVKSDGIKKAISTAVSDETNRATAAEQNNADAIVAETNRATAAEQNNADAIVAETNRATAAEQNNADAIVAETTRATAAETSLQNMLYSSKNAVNALSLGIDNTGTNDVSAIINNWDNTHTNEILFIPDGTYLLKDTLSIKNNNYYMVPTARFVASNIETAVSIDNPNTTINDKFFNLYVNGNNSCDICFDVSSVLDCNLKLVGYDARSIGVNLHKYNNVGVASTFEIYYENTNETDNSNIGVVMGVSDCLFTDIGLVNVKTGISLVKSGNVINRYTCWTRYPDVFPGTVSIRNDSGSEVCFNVFHYCAFDTMETFLAIGNTTVAFSLEFDSVFFEFNGGVTPLPSDGVYLWNLENMTTSQYLNSSLVFKNLFGPLNKVNFGTTGKCPIRTYVSCADIYNNYLRWKYDYNYMPQGTWYIEGQQSDNHLPNGLVCPNSICVCHTSNNSKFYIQSAVSQATNDAKVIMNNTNPVSYTWPYNTIYIRTVATDATGKVLPINPWMTFHPDAQLLPLS